MLGREGEEKNPEKMLQILNMKNKKEDITVDPTCI